MAAIQPGITMRVPNKLGEEAGNEQLGVSLRFDKMEDFNPAKVARQVPAMATLLEAREQLANLMRYMDGKVAAEDQLKKLLARSATHGRAERAWRSAGASPRPRNKKRTGQHGEGSQTSGWRDAGRDPSKPTSSPTFSSKASSRGPSGPRPRSRTPSTTLVTQALKDSSVVKDDVLDTIEEMIARLDQKLTEQMNEILHAPEFQQIESAWRGLQLSRLQFGNGREPQDPGHERFQDGAVPQPAALSGRASGTRARCSSRSTSTSSASWAASHMAPDRRLLFQPRSRPTSSSCAISARSPHAAHARSSPAPTRRLLGMDKWTELIQSARYRQGLRHAGICRMEGAARPG